MSLISGTYARAIVPTLSDTVNFPDGLCRGIYIGGAGNVVAIVNGVAVTFVTPVVGQVLEVQATRINVTNTTATNLLVMY